MDIHIGEKIKRTAKSKGIGATELAQILDQSRNNINNIFSRKSVDSDLLYSISQAIEFDFFELYSEKLKLKTENNLTISTSREELIQKVHLLTRNEQVMYKYTTMLEEKNMMIEEENRKLQNRISELESKLKAKSKR